MKVSHEDWLSNYSIENGGDGYVKLNYNIASMAWFGQVTIKPPRHRGRFVTAYGRSASDVMSKLRYTLDEAYRGEIGALVARHSEG